MPDQPYKVIVYSKPNCVQCNYVKRWLRDRGLEFETFDVTTPEGEKGLRKLRKWEYQQAPVTVIRYRETHRLVEHFAGYSITKLEQYFPKDKFPRIKK